MFDKNLSAAEEVVALGGEGATSLKDLVNKLNRQSPRIVWLMIPAGAPVEEAINELCGILGNGDIIIDAGNSNPRDSRRRARALAEKGIYFVDIGTSGGIEGAQKGVSFSVGGKEAAYRLLEPIIKAQAIEDGISFIPYSGMGHLTKMIHNTMEYALMQAIAEGVNILYASLRKDFGLNEPLAVEKLAGIVAEWSEDEVIGSYLLELLARGLRDQERFAQIGDRIGGGESGNWGLREARRLRVSATL